MIYDNKEEVLSLLRSGYSFDIASDRLKNNKEFIKEATKISYISLKFANPKFRDDKEIIMEAVKNCGWALEYASDKLRNDVEVVREAVKNCEFAFEIASKKIKEQYITPGILLNSEKEISNDNPWSKGNEDKSNAWIDKVNSDKASDLER